MKQGHLGHDTCKHAFTECNTILKINRLDKPVQKKISNLIVSGLTSLIFLTRYVVLFGNMIYCNNEHAWYHYSQYFKIR